MDNGVVTAFYYYERLKKNPLLNYTDFLNESIYTRTRDFINSASLNIIDIHWYINIYIFFFIIKKPTNDKTVLIFD